MHERGWPEELDALRAAPDHHTLLFENDRVRVLDTNIAPGDTVPLHTHRWPGALYLLSFSDFVRRDAAGLVLVDSRMLPRPTGQIALWTEALAPHTLENVGDAYLHVVCVEVKNQAI